MARYLNHIYKLTLESTLAQPESTKIIGTGTEVVITELQIKGNIRSSKGDATTINMSLDIYNLSDSTVDLISQENVIVKLEVGYPDQPLQELFLGNVLQVSTENRGTDRVTHILAVENLVNVKEATTNREWPYDITVGDIFKEIILKDLKLAVGDIHNVPLRPTEGIDKVLKKFTITGNSKVALDDLASGHNLVWNITKGEVHVYPAGSGRTLKGNDKIPLYTHETGLIRSPNRAVINSDKVKGSVEKKSGKVFEVVLNPALVVGGSIKVESRTFNEEVVIKEISHNFNYYKGKWQSSIIGESA